MRVRTDGRLWDVTLRDDGTMDTVIEVQPVAVRRQLAGQQREYWPAETVRFDADHAADCRDRDGAMTTRGLRELGLEAIGDYWQSLSEEDLQEFNKQ